MVMACDNCTSYRAKTCNKNMNQVYSEKAVLQILQTMESWKNNQNVHKTLENSYD